MKCSRCGCDDVAEIGFRFDDGVTMGWCRRCEHRWWERDGVPVDLEEILGAAASLRRVPETSRPQGTIAPRARVTA
jgi:hypothetical protein